MATTLILIALIVLSIAATVRLAHKDPTTTPPASHRNDEFVPNLSAKF